MIKFYNYYLKLLLCIRSEDYRVHKVLISKLRRVAYALILSYRIKQTQ